MRKRGLILALGAVLLTVAAVSCKDDDEDEYLYLDGTLKFNLDAYLAPNTTVVLTPTGVSHPEGKEITYVWTCYSSESEYTFTDTTDVETYFFADTLQSYRVTCSATA
ncbi:MAG: hypothetical protein LUC24_03470, partial [Bacteroidales bacterium]|nr:hypothetical protein [Bacteroidales bacterium]